MFLWGGFIQQKKPKKITGRFHFLSNIFSTFIIIRIVFYSMFTWFFFCYFFGLLWPALVNNSNVAHIGIIILLLWSPNSQQQRLQQKKTMWYLVREREKEMLNNTFCVFVWVNEMMMARDIIIIIIIDSMVSLGCLVCVCIWVSFGAWSESQRRAFLMFWDFFLFLSFFGFLFFKRKKNVHYTCVLYSSIESKKKRDIFLPELHLFHTHTYNSWITWWLTNSMVLKINHQVATIIIIIIEFSNEFDFK